MKTLKNITIYGLSIIFIGLFSIEIFSERGFNCWLEDNFGIESDCDGYNVSNNNNNNEVKVEKYYEMNCGIDVECWDRLLDSFFNTMLNDLEDGILDGDYYYGNGDNNNIGWYDLKSKKLDRIADEMIQYEISQLINEKLKKIDISKQRVIMEEMALQWN